MMEVLLTKIIQLEQENSQLKKQLKEGENDD